MISGIKNVDSDIVFTAKRHYCPVCNTRLTLIKHSKIINSKSPEAKNYDFCVGDVYLVGNVKFIWKEFECSNCKKHFTVKEIKQYERNNKRTKIKVIRSDANHLNNTSKSKNFGDKK